MSKKFTWRKRTTPKEEKEEVWWWVSIVIRKWHTELYDNKQA
jgi:hypothetical protein